MADPLQPALLRFTPVYKPYVWGGTDLPRRLGRAEAPRLERYAESWELADHPDGMSVAEGGPYAGETLHALTQRFGAEQAGRPAAAFPLLVKVLDAADRLSVQVHPDDAAALRDGGEAKTECWYILEAAPGASVWAGLKPGVTPALFRRALADGTVQGLLRSIPVRRGDLLFIPGGRVHAIGAGCLILEVQQRSNTTYRVYDWDRRDAEGKARPLHVEQALQTIRWDDAAPALTPTEPAPGEPGCRILPRLLCPYFIIDELSVREPLELRGQGDSFQAFFTVSGGIRLRTESGEFRLPEGRTGLLPALARACTVRPEGAEARLLRISLPRPG
jgi:mannose-6-phosphate isomerase